MYRYRAEVIDVYDGDTVTVDVDLGLCIWVRRQKIRLYGIDAPELRGEDRGIGIKVRDWLRNRIANKRIVLETIKDEKGKFGRWLGKIWIDGVCVNDEMLELGLVKEYGD